MKTNVSLAYMTQVFF